MWQPEAGWERLPSGPSGHGVWRVSDDAGTWAVKRLRRPDPGETPLALEPGHPTWWRREADVAIDRTVESTPGLRGAPVHRVDEDDEGLTLWHAWVADAAPSGLFLARALGAFAGAQSPPQPWEARDLLRSRLRMVERRGGWTTLARTTVADVADHLWSRRESMLARCDALPQVLQHGDPVPANLPGRDGDTIVAVDWSTLGRGPVGADLGYLSLTSREELDPLLTAYVDGLPPHLATREQVLLGARVMAVYTVLTRADWALARVADGEGALAGKFRHPSVAPTLRSLQRQLPQVEALLG